MTTTTTSNSRGEALAELAERYPEVDWAALVSAPAEPVAPEEVAFYLIAAGRDPGAVKRMLDD